MRVNEVNKRDEDSIKLIGPGENAAKSLEPSEQSFDLVAFFVHGTAVPLTVNPGCRLGRKTGM